MIRLKQLAGRMARLCLAMYLVVISLSFYRQSSHLCVRESFKRSSNKGEAGRTVCCWYCCSAPVWRSIKRRCRLWNLPEQTKPDREVGCQPASQPEQRASLVLHQSPAPCQYDSLPGFLPRPLSAFSLSSVAICRLAVIWKVCFVDWWLESL